MSSLFSLLNESNPAEMPKNFESSLVWMPMSSASSACHLPALATHLPAVPSLSFHLLTVHLSSQPGPKVSEKKVLPLARPTDPTHANANFMMGIARQNWAK